MIVSVKTVGQGEIRLDDDKQLTCRNALSVKSPWWRRIVRSHPALVQENIQWQQVHGISQPGLDPGDARAVREQGISGNGRYAPRRCTVIEFSW